MRLIGLQADKPEEPRRFAPNLCFQMPSDPNSPDSEARASSRSINARNLEEIAQSSLSSEPRPFLRWAGSKRAHLGKIIPVLPKAYRTYWEPFAGAASLFFLLRPVSAVLADSCVPLMYTYRAVRDGPRAILRHLDGLTPDKSLYYEIRGRTPENRFQAAADFIYLNKTCWNGLYRVNKRGEFNVPYGRPLSDGIVDDTNLIACSRLLRRDGIRLAHGDFEDTLEGVEAEDLVFLDPPYVTRHNNNGFVDYNEVLFSWEDQRRLAQVARRLVARGASIIVTNAYHQEILDLYEGFSLLPFDRRSTLAAEVSKRTVVKEAILSGLRQTETS